MLVGSLKWGEHDADTTGFNKNSHGTDNDDDNKQSKCRAASLFWPTNTTHFALTEFMKQVLCSAVLHICRNFVWSG